MVLDEIIVDFEEDEEELVVVNLLMFEFKNVGGEYFIKDFD